MNNLDLITCQICNYTTSKRQSFNSHITHKHKIKSKDYYDIYIKKDNEGACKTCGNNTSFINMWEGYRQFCCNSCMSSNKDIQEKRKQTCLKNYGVEFPHQSQKIKEATEKTNINKYGASNVYASEYGKEKIKATNLKRYGVEYPMQSQKIKDKVANTCKSIYGSTSPLANEDVKQKIRQTCKDKYNVDWTSQIPESREKTKQTNLNKYGNEYIFKLDRVRKLAGSHEARLKALRTAKANNTRSSLEVYMEELLSSFSIVYKCQYKDDRYPFWCDFYLPDTDTFVEINGYWMHGGHWFDENNENDLNIINKWKSKNTSQYNRAIYVWTKSDLEKRNTAINNKLNYIVLWNKTDIENYINSLIK